jgi:hypothetical protein
MKYHCIFCGKEYVKNNLIEMETATLFAKDKCYTIEFTTGGRCTGIDSRGKRCKSETYIFKIVVDIVR